MQTAERMETDRKREQKEAPSCYFKKHYYNFFFTFEN